MNNGEFSKTLMELTAIKSHFENTRDYVSLSHIALTSEEIIKQFNEGFEETLDIKLKCYKGYQMEADLLSRIKLLYGDRVKTGVEVIAFDGLVKGHPDFILDGDPGDCKSVLLDEWFPKDGKLPRRIYWQMQGYMRYMNRSRAIVVFESRESGKIMDYWIRENPGIQAEIENKLKQVVKLIKQ